MEDKLIEFKRFPKDKQEQVRQFVAYAQMCGLSGRDIRSIGDKLDRDAKAVLRRQNLEIAKGFDCLPIGDDKRYRGGTLQGALDRRFKLKTARGAYNFTTDYDHWIVKSLTTSVVKNYKFDQWKHELTTGSMDWYRRSRYGLLLEINNGNLKLDF